MPLTIEQPAKLAADQRCVFDALCGTVNDRRADDDYDAIPRADGGRIISVDLARFLAPEFSTWDGRLRHTPSTGSPAGAYAHDRLLRELRRRGKRRSLLITAGGAGSGKTTMLGEVAKAADLVFDNQFRDVERARQILETALRSNWLVNVVYVHRPLLDVSLAVIERSQRTGRWNSLASLFKMHCSAQSAILSLRGEFLQKGVTFVAKFNVSERAANTTPFQHKKGDRVLFKELKPEGRYHLGNAEEAGKKIAQVLQTAIQNNTICREVAEIIGKEVP